MLDGVMLLWFSLTVIAVAFVAADICSTPESVILKWGFVLVTAYTGPFGAFLYVLGCREPLPGLHERYTAARWRQVLGSTMHCVAGDGVGILAGAAIASYLTLSQSPDIVLEYALGFGFGWTIFQALFMRDMAGGSYRRALRSTLLPEFASMNLLMTGMLPIAALGRTAIAAARTPLHPAFLFVMSIALLGGFITAYPANWWLVAKGLKHGMMTVRPEASGHAFHEGAHTVPSPLQADHHKTRVSRTEIAWVTLLSIAFLAAGIALSFFITRRG